MTKGNSSGKRRKTSGASSRQGEPCSVPSHSMLDTDSGSARSVSHVESEEGFLGFDEDILVDVSHALSVPRVHASPSLASRFSGNPSSGRQVSKPGAPASSLAYVSATPPLPASVVVFPAVSTAASSVSGLASGSSFGGARFHSRDAGSLPGLWLLSQQC